MFCWALSEENLRFAIIHSSILGDVRTRLQERFAITWQSDWNMGNAMAYTRW
jgi:hypothetical protein